LEEHLKKFSDLDAYFMTQALLQAKEAFKKDEVPVGAVLVDSENRILAREHNRILELCDPTAHAEVLAIRKAAKVVGNYRLTGCKIYTTLEPCPMCSYAIVLARIDTVFVATTDPKTGAAGSCFNFLTDPRLNHKVTVKFGLFKEVASKMLKTFFKARR